MPQAQIRVGPADPDRRGPQDGIDDRGGPACLLRGLHLTVYVGDGAQPLDHHAVLVPDRGDPADHVPLSTAVGLPEPVPQLLPGAVGGRSGHPVPVLGVHHSQPTRPAVLRPRLSGVAGQRGLLFFLAIALDVAAAFVLLAYVLAAQ